MRHHTGHCGSCTQFQIGLHLHHRHLHGAIAKYLQHQSPIELDVGLHQHCCSGHFTQHVLHWRGIGPRMGVRRAATQDFYPGVGQTHHGTTYRQPIKQKLVQLRHARLPSSQPTQGQRLSNFLQSVFKAVRIFDVVQGTQA